MSDENETGNASLPVKLEWLQETLNKSVGAEGILLGAACQTLAEGKGFVSFVTKLDLQWDEKNSKGLEKLPKSVITKQPTTSKLSQLGEDLAKAITPDLLKMVHNREVFAYHFLNSHGAPPFAMPRIYFAEEISDSSDGILILEDLTENTGSMQFSEYFSLGQIEALIDAIASMQAYGMKFPSWHDKIDGFDKSLYDDFFKNWFSSVEFVRETFPEKFTFTDDQMNRLFEENKDTLNILCDIEGFGHTPVIAYGDLQPNNILWKLNEAGQPSDKLAAMLDYQILHKGVSFEDLTYLIFFYLSPDDRRANENRLIELYYKSLEAKLAPNKPIFSLTDSKNGYKQLLGFYAVMYVSVIKMFVGAMKFEGEKKESMIHHLLGALQDAGIDKY